MKQFQKLGGIGIFLISISLSAHGENKPGPHGGSIQMPGAFHTEVLDYEGKGFKIYLLDIEFKNPYTKNSKVNAKVVAGDSRQDLKCSSHPDHFYCEGNFKVYNKDSYLELDTMRNGSKGMMIKYKLPLQENK